MEEEPKKPQKGILYYYGLVILGILVFNALVAPLLVEQTIEPVGYNQLLADIESGTVTEMEINDQQIYYRIVDADGQEVVRSTGAMDDPDFVTRLQAHPEVTYTKIVPQEMSPLAKFLTSWLLPFILLFAIGQFFMSRMQKRMGGGNAMAFGKSNAKIYVKAQTGVNFSDVAGQNEAKEAMGEIVDFLHNPQKYTEIGATLPKGALLVGPPGTGKTLLAKAVAGEAEVPFFSISGSEFVEMFVGMGAAKVRDLFKQANEKAPCIVFIDEIDTIGKKRNSGMGGNDEREQTLNQLLTEMDGFDGKKGVVILAATNRPESLDPALLRPGRFDRRIPVELPDLAGREAILKVHSTKVKMEDAIDLNAIARATSGASGAELANMVNEAALRAVRMERNAISQSDLEESVEVILAGYQRKNSLISEKEKKIVAYHEIGHALVAAKQSGTAPVHKITIVPRTSGALGYTMQVEEGEKVLMSKTEALQKICTYTGGRAAEALIFDSITSGASNDIEQATKIARMMVSKLGMSDTFGMTSFETQQNQYLGGESSLNCSPETAREIDMQVMTIIAGQYEKATEILKENKDKLNELADYLLEKETISGDEFMSILSA
ncbi:ATP-dependent zinc metalloprotease FtsH [Eubacteriaceae bacterium ES3]|nr:ATP-dependent zinc metalloprotease FtsH [Eubacteriaceae bacterium ES3]